MEESKLEFDKYVEVALHLLPNEFRDKIDNVSIVVEDFPSQDQLIKLKLRRGHTLLGLYEGIPQTKRGNYGVGPTVPDKITLFKYPILYSIQNKEQLLHVIRDTLYHEIGHHFGMSEEELERAQNKLP